MAQVGSLKDSFAKRESRLVADKAKALDSFQQIEAQFKLCDDAFRQQLAAKSKQTDTMYIKLQETQEELEHERKRVYACNVERTRLYKEIDELKQASTSRIDQIRALIDNQ